MSAVVNLRTVRKQRKRAEDRSAADLRAAATGETRAARKRREREAARAERVLDQHRIDPSGDA